jgi:hypothetical protein
MKKVYAFSVIILLYFTPVIAQQAAQEIQVDAVLRRLADNILEEA